MSIATPVRTEMERPPDVQQPRSVRGTPTWEIAHLFPEQGEWSEEEYFNLDTNHLVEYVDGCLEFLPMPTKTHQLIVQFLVRLLHDFVQPRRLGTVVSAPYRVRLREGLFREPDVLLAFAGRRLEETESDGADLVVEVVSPDPKSRKRDLEEKRAEYAAAGIPEYWIVDPQEKMITVLVLDGDQYRVHGEFKPDETATSVLLDGFKVDVAACFAAAEDGQTTAEANN